ncbi:murein hydrolase activator EnvC family protein [Pseudodesulfovibrio sp.]|uniref:murein hydrolase activator EnvC family protein n=1 Tax=unclassified Pseudodesulfovibrio TaxID=2661612 RepID=UPI003AFF6F75
MQFALTVFLAVLLCPAFLTAQEPPEALHDSLQKEHQRADEKEQEVRKLTRKAGSISSRLTNIESDIRSLRKQIDHQEKVLNGIRENEQKARDDHFALEKEKERIASELSGLVGTLWPVHLQNVRARFQDVDSWDMFDRRFNWLSEIYVATKGKFDEARENSRLIAQNLERQRLLEHEATEQLEAINRNKDQLLGNKYALRKNLQKVRKRKEDIESELNGILATIQELKYQLQSQKTKRFNLYQRMLPWPVKGRQVALFNLSAKPPVRGLGLSTDKDAQVQSVFWGKVVHNDTLRGFGNVVIVYHGYNYYSLYAYLSKTYVRNGQEVEKDEPLGVVGYYPQASGPGLYFELRFHQKPINPKLWLTSLH